MWRIGFIVFITVVWCVLVWIIIDMTVDGNPGSGQPTVWLELTLQ